MNKNSGSDKLGRLGIILFVVELLLVALYGGLYYAGQAMGEAGFLLLLPTLSVIAALFGLIVAVPIVAYKALHSKEIISLLGKVFLWLGLILNSAAFLLLVVGIAQIFVLAAKLPMNS